LRGIAWDHSKSCSKAWWRVTLYVTYLNIWLLS